MWPTASARRCATSQKYSTGVSASPCSSSDVAAHVEQSWRIWQFVHFVWRVAGFVRVLARNWFQPSAKLPLRRSYESFCESTQMFILPSGSIENAVSPPPQ